MHLKNFKSEKIVSDAVDMLASLVADHGWQARSWHHNWVRWIPREWNRAADWLANLAMDESQCVAWESPDARRLSSCNVLLCADGGWRSTGSASAAWVALACGGGEMPPIMVACGAAFLKGMEDSIWAEAQAAAAAVAVLGRATAGGTVVPHPVTRWIKENEARRIATLAGAGLALPMCN